MTMTGGLMRKWMKMSFKIGDIVRVTNVDGWDSNGYLAGGIFEIKGVGEVGIIVDIEEETPWPIEVLNDHGTFFYNASELELVEE